MDLAYITERIIAMAAPCEGRESLYRNPMDQVARFLHTRHSSHCRVYNLCAERAYDVARLGCQVVRYLLEDHQARTLLDAPLPKTACRFPRQRRFISCRSFVKTPLRFLLLHQTTLSWCIARLGKAGLACSSAPCCCTW